MPNEAWRGQSFEYLAGGRTCVGVRLQTGESDLWALRADDPDKFVAGRVWTTEMVIGQFADELPRFSARLFASTSESSLDIDVSVPGFIRQIASTSGFVSGAYSCLDHAWWISNEEDARELISRLLSVDRALPLVMITTGDAGYDAELLPIDPDSLAAATIGLAHIAVIPEELTWQLSQELGRPLSVFNGGIRVYQPGFSSDDNPYGPHDLILAKEISTPDAAERAMRWLKAKLAAGSVKRVRMGTNSISYQDVRDAVIVSQQKTLEVDGASSDEKLVAANERIKSLEGQLNSDAEWTATLEADNRELTDRAETFEALANASKQRITQLSATLSGRGAGEGAGEDLPKLWSEFADWCDRAFPGRLLLSSRGRREAKDADFEDVELAARSLVWLASDYRTARLEGGDGTLRDHVIEQGIRNSPCGSDTYETNWKNKKRNVDWHLKNGGNTRDPKRCFRAYYFWDDQSEQVVVDHVPSHRVTSAS